MGEKKKSVTQTLFTNFTNVIASLSMEEFVHYSEDKITCKVLAFLWTEHENKELLACCFAHRLFSGSLMSVVQS